MEFHTISTTGHV